MTPCVQGPDGEQLWRFWHEQLQGSLPVLHLPTDKHRPAQLTGGCSSRVCIIPVSVTTGVTASLRAPLDVTCVQRCTILRARRALLCSRCCWPRCTPSSFATLTRRTSFWVRRRRPACEPAAQVDVPQPRALPAAATPRVSVFAGRSPTWLSSAQTSSATPCSALFCNRCNFCCSAAVRGLEAHERRLW